jgi:pimeloyl-ACP methyl ester carboxylesterase
MKSLVSSHLMAILVLALSSSALGAESAPFPGVKSSYHSYDRYDFEHNKRQCIVVTPKHVAQGKPWIWRAMFFDDPPQVDLAMLDKGFHLVYVDVSGMFGSSEAVTVWDDFYKFLTDKHGLGRKPVLEGMSRGALIVYAWGASNPDKVGCIYGDAPVCDIKSWPSGKGSGRPNPVEWANFLKVYGMTEEEALKARCNPLDRLEPLAKAKVPIIHVVGDADIDVPVAENTAILEQRYKKLGGLIKVIHKPGVGHQPHSLDDPTPIVEFILKNVVSDAHTAGSVPR